MPRPRPAGRFQLSLENAYRVRSVIPSSGAVSIATRTASAPRRCPAMRGNPRASAQRPLPSMMIAQWKVEPFICFVSAHGRPDQGLHVIEIEVERATTCLSEGVLRSGHALPKAFGAADVTGFLQFARVDADFPSVVRRMFRISTKVSASLAARALMMPRRTRS